MQPNWVQVQISKDTPKEDVESLAKENKISCKMQKNGYMLVYGNGESVKSFVKKLAGKFHDTRKR